VLRSLPAAPPVELRRCLVAVPRPMPVAPRKYLAVVLRSLPVAPPVELRRCLVVVPRPMPAAQRRYLIVVCPRRLGGT
jgi:hypothetical protein